MQVYDEYLPYTKEAKQLIGLVPLDSDSKPLITIFDSKFKGTLALFRSPFQLPTLIPPPFLSLDLFSGKKTPEKPAVPKSTPKEIEKSAPSDNAPFIPKEGVKVVVTEAPPSTDTASGTEPTDSKAERKGEDREDIPVRGPPMGAKTFKEGTSPLIGLEEEENVKF